MARKRTWYTNYIGYCFNDNGREVILEDVFYYEDEKGKITGAGYELRYTDTNECFNCDYQIFKEIVNQTNLPK